jgi:hypothetical protein
MCGIIFNAALSSFLAAVTAFAGVCAGGTAVSTPADAVAFCKALGTGAAGLTAAAGAMAGAQATWLSASSFCAPSAAGPGVIPPISPFLL